jgi:hypothetical protein
MKALQQKGQLVAHPVVGKREPKKLGLLSIRGEKHMLEKETSMRLQGKTALVTGGPRG